MTGVLSHSRPECLTALRAAMVISCAAWIATACATGGAAGATSAGQSLLPGHSVKETLERAIAMLEDYRCADFAVNFLSPIKRATIPDLEAYRKTRQCSATDRGNLDDVLLALKLALGAQPVVTGVKATIDLSGIGIKISKFEFVRFTDGRWYFNDL